MTSPVAPALALASTSPRRRALLEAAGIDFVLVEPGDEPVGPAGATPRALAELRARAKAVVAVAPAAGRLVLGVDTVVDLDGVEFGKPRDRADAARMVRALAGREHEVHTGHCLRCPETRIEWVEIATSRVSWAAVDDAWVAAYLDTGDWAGKAGGYGIQDGPASRVARVNDGDRDTVVGLSLRAVRSLLARAHGDGSRTA